MNPVDLISSAPWTRVVFSTYALSLSFFEAVILDALLRGRARGALILSDLEGVRAALSEEGARRVGRDYEIAPVVCNRPGVFHPKVSVLANEVEVHLLVGSGNLTFSGWGGNLEVIEHLHPSFAADAFDDAANFFDALATSKAVTTTHGNACREVAIELRKAADRGDRNGEIRLLHSLDAPIAEQIALYADDLGGATRIAIASPYFELTGKGIADLAEMTECDNVLLHAHPSGTVGGGAAPPWPYATKRQWQPVTITHLASDHRRLHAKTMEIQCKRGRLLVAGSANATSAGLFGNNIEASVLRVQRDTKLYWLTSVGTPPVRPDPDDEKAAEVEAEFGVLHAKLEGDMISGRILKPLGSGQMQASLRSPLRSAALGEIGTDAQGQFNFSAAGFELDALQTGRLVLRLEQDCISWEGFLSISITLELIRKTGSIASKLIAMLGGTDTPDDVAAILAWFKEDTSRLPALASVSGGRSVAENVSQGTTFVTLGDLTSAHFTSTPKSGIESDPQLAWQRAMAMIRTSFAQIRGPWQDLSSGGDDVDEDDVEGLSEKVSSQRKAKDKSRKAFVDLLDVILDPAAKGSMAPIALSLAHFLTDRIRPEPREVQSWVQRILSQISEISGPEAEIIIATALLYYSLPQQGCGPITSRRFFLKRGVDPCSVNVNPACITAFIDVLDHRADLAKELHRARTAVTMGEQIHRYLEAAAGRGPHDGFDSLKKSPHWPRLLRALQNRTDFAKISILEEATDFCPLRHIRLSSSSRLALRSDGVTVCDCCGRIILNKDC